MTHAPLTQRDGVSKTRAVPGRIAQTLMSVPSDFPDQNRHLLEAAGYVWDEQARCWEHPTAKRLLNGEIARGMSVDQLTAWIADGANRRGPA